MLTLTQHLVIIGAVQGILLFILLNFDSRTSTANRLMGVLCLLLGLYFLGPFIAVNGELNKFSFLLGWSFFLPASFGALNYLYYRHAVTNVAMSWKDLWLFTPVVLCYLLNFHWLTSSPEERLILVQGFNTPPEGFITSIYIVYAQAFIYNGFSAWLIYKYQRKAQNNLANFNPDIFRWLWTFLGLTFVIWTFKAIADFADIRNFSHWGDLLIVLFIYSVAIAQWRNPMLFRVEKLDTQHSETELANPTTKHKSDSSFCGALDHDTRSSLLDSTKTYMEEHRPYLDNQLTLSSLAEAIGLSSHHLSEVLNQQEGKNFYQFVNQYRINHVLEQLKHDQSSKILDLAFTAGCASKSTFNAVFKQFTRQTPSQYRKTLSSQ